LLSCLIGLVGALGLLFGDPGLLVLFGFAATIPILISITLAPRILLWRHRAHPLSAWQAPGLYTLLKQLSARSNLDFVPQLFLLPVTEPIAFTTGHGGNAAIGLSSGLIETLNQRELTGVLAHEVAHIRNGDTLIHCLADGISNVVRFLSFFGILLLAAHLPILLVTGASVPWALIVILLLAPQGVLLLQLALSRTREFNADLVAAELTHDPLGLADALRKIELGHRRLWRRWLLPLGHQSVPSLLRTHPPTEERVSRLEALSAEPTGGMTWGYPGHRPVFRTTF